MDKRTLVSVTNMSESPGQEYVCSQCRDLDGNWFPVTPGTEDESSKLQQVMSKLRLHYVPSETETTAILSTIKEQETDLEGVNKKLACLKAAVERLEARQKELENNIQSRSALLSPIRRLPDEILSEIFLFCSTGRVDVCSPRSEIWRIEKVCKRWQDVAISLREIWSTIDVNLGSLAPYKATVPIETVDHLVSLCLQRSGERPLTIRFVEIGIPAHFKQIFRLLSQCSNRWEILTFSLSMLEESHEFERGVPMLKALELFGNNKGPIPMNSFTEAERLSRLRLHSVSRPLRNLSLPWTQLRYLDVSLCTFSAREFTDILRLTPNLLTLVSKWNKGYKINGNLPLSRAHLRHLMMFIFEASPSDIYITLPSLYMPALFSLTIRCGTPNASNPYNLYLSDSVVAFIRASHCSLTTLSLSSVDSPCVSRILEATPTLTCLYLGYIQGIEYNLQELSSQSTTLIPRLEEFHLMWKINQGMISIYPLIEFIQKRGRLQQSSPSLKQLDLTLKEQRGVGYFAQILAPEAMQSGIRVTIHSLPI